MRPEDHAAPFGTAGGELLVGGLPLRRLAARVGSTPFFAYDRAAVTRRVGEVRAAIGEAVDLSYAVKANPMPALVGHLAGLVDGLDVASVGEMRVALDAGTSPAAVSFAGPGKTDPELRCAVAAGVLVEVESPGEARRLVTVADEFGLAPRVAVRVNPDFAVRGSGMRMSGGPQQFGIDVEQAPALVEWLAEAGADLVGLHVFSGSQNLDAGLLVQAQRRTLDLLLELADKAPAPLRRLTLGGGFGIPYFPADEPLDLAAVGDHLRALAVEAAAETDARLGIELGRYLVGQAGVYVTRVVDRKVSRGRTYLVVDGGMHHQLAASGNLGQVIRRDYPVVIGTRVSAPPVGEATVVGCLCTPLDVLAQHTELPAASPGDLVVVFCAGAYGLTASPVNFLGHPPPAEVLV